MRECERERYIVLRLFRREEVEDVVGEAGHILQFCHELVRDLAAAHHRAVLDLDHELVLRVQVM